jgi:outer membrane protein OmpA-like peptidoglycan-associated protein
MRMTVVGVLALLFLAGCVIDSHREEDKVENTGDGATSSVAASSEYYVDRHELALRRRLKGSKIQVERQGQDIKLMMSNNINFAPDSAIINSEFYSILNTLGINLKEFSHTHINGSGYTDSTGSDVYNQELSEYKANAVASYMVKAGVNRIRIQSRGFAERYPVAPNNSVMGRSQNRRVEMTIRPR